MKKTITIALMIIFVSISLFANGTTGSEEEDIVIAGIVFQEDQFFRVIQKGMKAAAEDYGVTLLMANSQNKLDKEIELVNTYIARGVDALAISPLSDTGSVAALQSADDEGIVVVTYNSPVSANFPVSYINSSQSELGGSSGMAARQYIEEQLGGSARVATLAFKSLLPEISDMRVNGFLDALSGLDIEVVSQQDAWLAEDAVARGGDIITANPDVDIIYAANDGGTVGAVGAVRNAGKEDQIKVFGIDASEQIAEMVLAEDGVLMASTGQQPFEIGYQAVEFAVMAVKGESVEPTVIVPGLLLDRNDSAAVMQFKTDWAKLIQ